MKITQPKKRAYAAQNVDSSGVFYDDTGGNFGGGSITLQDILDLLGAGTAPDQFLRTILGGVGVVQALGTLGSTETIDLANANYFWGTLDQDCTITTTGWTNLKDCQITVEWIQDGTGGWLPTFTGVTWIGDAPEAGLAGTVGHAVLFSRDGGTTIYGAVLGGAGVLQWIPMTVFEPTISNWLPFVDGDGNQIMAEV